LRNVYFGTSDFAATVLEALLASDHAPNLVVTRPSRPKGRGKKLQDAPVAVVARERGVELIQPEDLTAPEAVDAIRAASPDALTVCAYGAIVREPLLSMVPSFNVHPSLLPRWRGAAPVERAIMAGDVRTGVTIMRLVEELDAGPMCAQEVVEIGDEDDYGTLAPQLAALGGSMLTDALTRAENGGVVWTQQLDGHTESEVTYAEKIVREDRQLRPREQSAVEMSNVARALNPHIGAFFVTATGDPLRVRAARVVEDAVDPGVCEARDGRLLVGSPEMTLELLRVQPAGGRAMDVESFLRGNEAPTLA
jgi:methionyl-tRNA formyltransferase